MSGTFGRVTRRRLTAALAGALATVGMVAPAPATTDWSHVKAGTNARFADVAFANSDVGMAIGPGGFLLYTGDGGLTWQERTTPTSADLRTVTAQPNCGTGPCFWIGTSNGQILFSADGVGGNWCAQNTGTTERINGLFSAGITELYAVGTNGVILSTTSANNCQTTYATLPSGLTRILNGVVKVPNGPLVVVGASGTILRQSNGGPFEALVPEPTKNELDAVAVASGPGVGGYTLTAVGEGGTILQSNNATEWRMASAPTRADLHDVTFPVNHLNGFAVGHFGTVLATSDGGKTWVRRTTSRCNNLFGISMLGNNNGWAAGGSGTIMVTPGINGKNATAPFCATTGAGYRMVASDGGIFSFGDAVFFGSTGDIKLNKPIVSMATTPTGGGYWLVASDGGVFSFGDAEFFGSTGDIKLNKPIVGMASTPTGEGYWMVASDGGIFAFGDAAFHGSTGNIKLNSPIVAMASTPSGDGYWLGAADGGLFAFGDATFAESAAGKSKGSPIVGMATTPDGEGQWMAAADGGVFAMGAAEGYGSLAGTALSKPIVGMAATASGLGYWLVASDGGIFAFGDAQFYGSTGAIKLNQPIVGMAVS